MGTAREAMPSAAFGIITGRRQAGGMGRALALRVSHALQGPSVTNAVAVCGRVAIFAARRW